MQESKLILRKKEEYLNQTRRFKTKEMQHHEIKITPLALVNLSKLGEEIQTLPINLMFTSKHLLLLLNKNSLRDLHLSG